MSVHQTVSIPVMRMQCVTTLKAATGVSVGQDSLEMDTTAQVLLFTKAIEFIRPHTLKL